MSTGPGSAGSCHPCAAEPARPPTNFRWRRRPICFRPGQSPDIWDSGRVESDASIHVAYAGPALASRARYYWRVKIWDETGAESSWSEITWWENGLKAQDWKADWINSPIVGGPKFAPPVPALRRGFEVKAGQITSVRLYISALGLFEAYLNGQRIGDEFFAPGWTDYRKTIQYRGLRRAVIAASRRQRPGSPSR